MTDPRVLIVDDNVSLAETVADVLADEGYEVDLADSGAQALVNWRRRPADVVVVDVDLPDIRGLTIARRLARRPSGCRILIVSAGEPEGIHQLRHEVGARFLAKPFALSRLLETIRSLIQEQRQPRTRSRALLGVRLPRGLLQFRRRSQLN